MASVEKSRIEIQMGGDPHLWWQNSDKNDTFGHLESYLCAECTVLKGGIERDC